jgi:hypothetical protein
MFISFLTGASFTIGILLVLLGKDIYLEKSSEEETWVELPNEVTIVNHAIKPNAVKFTIVGEIRNNSSYDWKRIWIEADIFAGTALVNSCDESFRDIPANATRPFELQCYDTAGTNLPDNIRYEVRVRTGLRP